ncbi:MAG: response regulator [Cyanobacteria bacterium J06631_2]
MSDQTKASIPEVIKVLILASNSLLSVVTDILEKANLSVNWQYAASQEEYYDLLGNRFDLVLYDASLDGIALTEAIASLSVRELNIPLIVINGETSIPAAVTAIKTGAADYISQTDWAKLPQAINSTLLETDFLCLQSQCTSYTDQQLQKLISENADGIIVVDEQGIVRFLNPAALELLGRSRVALVGEALGFPVVNGDFLEVDLPVSPDKTLVAQMRVSHIKWQGVNAFVVSLRDITQLKQAELERVKLLEEAQAANRAKDEFLAILSHELRTPLNPIVGWSQMLVKGNLAPEQVKQGAEIIQRNAMLQTKLIEDILDISRIIRGKLDLQAVPTNLVRVIHNALDTVNLAAQAKSIEIESNLDENIGLVQADSTRLQQVVWNLVTNAVKFTPSGGRVEINLRSVDSHSEEDNFKDSPESNLETNFSFPYAQIQVIDSGKGIDPEFLPYVFDYFRQAESGKSRSKGGLGLGLAIVRRLVELHGGEVSARSEGLGKGAVFTVSLPILNTKDAPNKKRSPKNSTSLEGVKILIVDDDDSSRYLLALVLEQESAQIKTSASATEALEKIEQFQPDILISDIGMPHMDGYELIKRVRELDLSPDFRAIAFSAYASEQDSQKSLDMGFDRHINKPLDVNHLVKIVAQLANDN